MSFIDILVPWKPGKEPLDFDFCMQASDSLVICAVSLLFVWL